MASTLLVVEYEPRYVERLQRALADLPVDLVWARDGAEALAVFDRVHPQAIVLSWILPKTSGAELIRALRTRPGGDAVRILLTVSGYTGRDSAADAKRAGADDLVAKPFAEADLARRVAALLGIEPGVIAPTATAAHPGETHPAAAHAVAAQEESKLTSSEIFGDVLEDERAPASPPPRPPADDEIDALLDRTVVSLRKKSQTRPGKRDPVADLDRLVQDTLSGLGKQRSAPPAAPAAAFTPRPPEDFERVPAASPVLEPAGEETITARPGARFGQFVLREKIATGGMAEVWKAQMQGVEGFEKLVAIKRILPHLSADQEFVDMFIDEAKIAARLNHPNIIHIYDLGRASGSYYIAMELVDGHDLKSTLRRASDRGLPMPVELAVYVASKLGAALHFAHRKAEGLVHRDVSPQNVLIGWEGDIKLCDFGIAKATSKVSHTQSGALKGKLQYMSPEQASGSPIDRRSDVFSLGLVLFEMLTGRKAFGGESEMTVLEQVRAARVAPPSALNDEVPAELDRIVGKALARDPGARYASAGDLVKDLDAVLYAVRPAPTAADLAVWMHRIWMDEAVPFAPAAEAEPAFLGEEGVRVLAPAPEPEVPLAPVAAPPESATPAEAHDSTARRKLDSTRPRGPISSPRPEPRRRSMLPVAALLALAALGAAGAWLYLRREPEPRMAEASPVAESVAPARPADATIVESAPVPAAELPIVEDDPEPMTIDTIGLVDEEVARRLEAERQRLEATRRAELDRARMAAQQSPPSRTTPVRSEPTPRAAGETPAASLPAASPPATATTGEVARPPETVEPPPSQASEPPPAPAPAVQRGAFVEPGTPGLVEPELLSLKKVGYPPAARSRRLEGIVILQVIVSETGSVLEAKILRGVSPDFGINDAALEAVRGGRFQPATVNGIPVRAQKVVTVPFKL